jgi:hypothetical protein
VTAVDKDETRAENFPIYQCDVTNSEDFALLMQYVEAEKEELLHVHFAPSCGTASRAQPPGHVKKRLGPLHCDPMHSPMDCQDCASITKKGSQLQMLAIWQC